MNRAVIAALAIAIPIYAAETKAKVDNATPESTSATTAESGDNLSPMVAAARRANRLGKKPLTVITNETLKKAGSSTAHVTTTESQPEIKLLTTPAEEKAKKGREAALLARAAEEKKRKALEEEAKKKSAEVRRQKALAAAESLDEGGYSEHEDTDPAQAERQLQEATGEPAAKPPEE